MVILIGASSSGKSTIEQEVDKRGICNKLTSYTTRPMRANEVEGVDYYFTNKDDFLKMENNNEFIEERVYLTKYGYWEYGLSKKEVDDNLNGIVVLDLDGARELEEYIKRQHPNEYVTTIFIDCNSKTRLLRSLTRDNCDEKKCDEICRRYLNDKGWEQEAKEYCDYVIWNEDNDDFENAIKFIESLKKD